MEEAGFASVVWGQVGGGVFVVPDECDAHGEHTREAEEAALLAMIRNNIKNFSASTGGGRPCSVTRDHALPRHVFLV